jgi:hypothetical protein
MLLSDSVALLGDQGKHFSDVYKLYEYRDDQLLKDYLDFVIHEPVEWMRGFPAKLVTKGAFSKPKAALIKLLKQETVIDALGEEYVKRVHDVVWAAFKKHAEDILAKRRPNSAVSVLDQLDGGASVQSALHHEEDIDDIASVHSVRLPREPRQSRLVPSTSNWEQRYRVLELAYREMLVDLSIHHPGAARSALTLLDALSD